MILAEKIMKLRKQQGWSQEDLAIRLDISRQSVSKWESGASIPDLNKILQLSELFSVSTDFLLKEDQEDFSQFQKNPEYEYEEENELPFMESEVSQNSPSRQVTMEEANEFMKLSQENAIKMAAAVSVCILSPVAMIILAGMAEYGKISITEDVAGSIGVIVLLSMIAGATAVFINIGMRLDKYSYLEKESIITEYGIAGIVEQRREQFEPVKRNCTIWGVVLCILSVVPMFCVEVMNGSEFGMVLSVAGLLGLVSAGAFLFVYMGMIGGSYDKLLEEGDYSRQKKDEKRKSEPLAGPYWLLVTAIYLVVSFLTKRWNLTWLIFVAAGGVYAVWCGVLAMAQGEKK